MAALSGTSCERRSGRSHRRIRWKSSSAVRAERGVGWVALLLAGCGLGAQEDGENPEAADATTPAVEVVQAMHGALPLRERLTGTVRATGQVAIYPQVTGPIIDVMARNGDHVERGEPLVRIRQQIPQSQLRQAVANLEVARADVQSAEATLEEWEARFSRTRELAEEGLVSDEVVESQRAQRNAARAGHAQAVAQVEQAEAAVAERHEGLEQTIVRAPITGRVGQRNAEVGMQVDGQTPLFIIGSLDRMRVEVPVTQEMLAWLEDGQRVEIRSESMPDTVIEAEVSRFSPFLAEGSFSAEAEIDVANMGGTLLPGMFVTVDVYYGESEQATLVPTSALYEYQGRGMGVFVAPSLGMEIAPSPPPGGSGVGALTPPTPTRFQPVEVVAEGADVIGLQGVEPGAWVVVVGQHLLSGQVGEDGPAARVRPVTWERVVGLQQLQRQDLLEQFMEKQQRLARQRADSIAAAGDASASGRESRP